MSDSLRPHESQHTRPPCPSPTPGVHSDSRPSESVMPYSHLILGRPLLLLPPIPPSIKLHNFNLIKLHFGIPVDIVIPFLGIDPEQINHQCFFKDNHHSVIYCLKTINQKQHKCASLKQISITKNNIFKEHLRPWRVQNFI